MGSTEYDGQDFEPVDDVTDLIEVARAASHEASSQAAGSWSGEPQEQQLGTEVSGSNGPPEVSPMDESRSSDSMPSFLRDEVAPILAAAEQAATQIVDRAREQAQQEKEELERMRREVEARVTELTSWQERVEPSIRSLQDKIADIQAKVDEVPELIRKALDPVATAISSLDPTLAEVASASQPVLSMEPLSTDVQPKFEDASS